MRDSRLSKLDARLRVWAVTSRQTLDSCFGLWWPQQSKMPEWTKLLMNLVMDDFKHASSKHQWAHCTGRHQHAALYTLKDKLNWPVLHLQYLQDKKIPRPTIFFWSSHKQKITCRQWFENFYPVSNSFVSDLLKTHYLLYLPQEARENSKTNLGEWGHSGRIKKHDLFSGHVYFCQWVGE